MSYSISNPLLVATFTVDKQNYRIIRTGPDYHPHLHLERQSKDLLGQEIWLLTLVDKNNWIDLFFNRDSYDQRKKIGVGGWYPANFLDIKGYISHESVHNNHYPDDEIYGIHEYALAPSSTNPRVMEKILRQTAITSSVGPQIVLAGIANYLLA